MKCLSKLTNDYFIHFRHFQSSLSVDPYINAIEVFINLICLYRFDCKMNSDLKLDFERAKKSYSSTHSILTEELKKLRIKLMLIPFPFCELECAWISVCTKIQPSECIISSLREVNQELQVSETKHHYIQYFWQ